MSTIRQILNIDDAGNIPGGVVRVARDTFSGSLDPSGTFSTLIDQVYGGASLTLSGARANPATGSDAPVVITATGNLLAQKSLPVVATFSQLDSGQVVARIVYTLPVDTAGRAKWTFRQDLPALPTVIDYEALDQPASPLDRLSLFSPVYIVANCAQGDEAGNLAPGINFRARMVPGGLLGAFGTIAGSGPLDLAGTVRVPLSDAAVTPLAPGQMPWDLSEPPPGVCLSAALAAGPSNLGKTASLSGLSFRLYSPPSNSWCVQNPSFTPLTGVSARLALPALGAELDVTALTAAGTAGATLLVTFPNRKLNSLSDLVDLVGGQDLESQLPGGLQKVAGGLGRLQLTRLAATIEASASALTLVQAAVSIEAPDLQWKLGGAFVVDALALDVEVTTPFSSPQLALTVRGNMALEGVPLVISARLAEQYTVTARLAEPRTLPLKKLMSSYVPDVPPPSDLTIDDVSFVVAPGAYYALSATMADQPNPWTIPLGPTGLTFSNVSLYAMKPQTGALTGSFAARAQLGALELTARYQIPGDVLITGRYPSVKLSAIISALTNLPMQWPKGFDLTFQDSYVLIEKRSSTYQLSLGTTVAEFGSLAFVVKNTAQGQWGFAAGLAISKARVNQLQGVGSFVQAFDDWFPFDQLVLAVSTITDTSFTFPAFAQFRAPALGSSKITLPAIAQGISRGFYLYASTTFTRKNRILGALIDLLKIPEGTALTCFFAYLADKSAFQLGISLATFLTPRSDPSQRSCQGQAGYDNGCLTGSLFVTAGGADGFTFGLAAAVKTALQGSPVDFNVLIAVEANGIFVSGTLDSQRPLQFGPLQLAGLALELGISYEGLPSFGFSATLDVAGAFESSLAVLVDSSNPAKSMIAGAISDLSARQVVDFLAGGSDPLPSELHEVLGEISIRGSRQGVFSVPAQAAPALARALDSYDAVSIADAFAAYGGIQGFPSSSTALTLFVDEPGQRWFLTSKTGGGNNSLITHYQATANGDGSLTVSKEAQFYFVPDPAGAQIGTFFYPAGMLLSGLLTFLFIELDVDIEIEPSRGIKVDAQLAPIQILSRAFFSITAADGPGGARLSLCTFSQPTAPPAEQSPHFLIDGQLTLLGVQRSILAKVNRSGLEVSLSGDIIPKVITGELSGTFTGSTGLDVSGDILVGIGEVDLGPFGTYRIDSGVTASTHVFAGGEIGATFTASFELAGNAFSLPPLSLDVSSEQLSDLPGKLLAAIISFLKDEFKKAPKLFAKLAREVLNWSDTQISAVLTGVLGLPPSAVQDILGSLAAVCSMTTAASLL